MTTKIYSQHVAQYLADSHNVWARGQEGESLYSVRGRKGVWYVWCDASDHEVEFDDKSIRAACRAAFDALNPKGN